MKNKEKYSLLEYILLAFIPFTEPNADLLYRRGRFINTIQKGYYAPKNSINSTISKAKKDGYLQEVEKKGKKGFLLTKKGRMKILKYIIKDQEEKKWDGRWRIVIFDIPENIKRRRDRFRDMLKIFKFIQLQKSVWISPHDHSEDLEMVIDELGIEEYVQYFITKLVSNSDSLKKQFPELK